MIGIRTDANSIIATGHIMRCITIAKEIVARGQAVTFFVADTESERLFLEFAEDGMDVVVLDTDYRDMDSELETLKSELKKRDVTALLVDSYMVTKGFFEGLKGICTLAYLDDLKADIYPVDILINYSGYSKNMGYEADYAGVCGSIKAPTKLLLGLNYAPLRRQFYEESEPVSVKEKGIHVLLSTGGADMCNMIVPVLEKVVELKLNADIIWNVVIGDFVQNKAEIEERFGATQNIKLCASVKNMAELMRKSDIAVLAAGTMLTECAAIRLPAVFYQVADNQKFNVEYFGATQGMAFAGSVMNGEDSKSQTIDTIIREVELLSADEMKRNTMREKLCDITDGRGAVRIAEALM